MNNVEKITEATEKIEERQNKRNWLHRFQWTQDALYATRDELQDIRQRLSDLERKASDNE